MNHAFDSDFSSVDEAQNAVEQKTEAIYEEIDQSRNALNGTTYKEFDIIANTSEGKNVYQTGLKYYQQRLDKLESQSIQQPPQNSNLTTENFSNNVLSSLRQFTQRFHEVGQGLVSKTISLFQQKTSSFQEEEVNLATLHQSVNHAYYRY